MKEHYDVLVVGAGLSGIDAGYRLQTMCPDKDFAIIEGRDTLGGTWDLFKYPGIRSDSDMFTLGLPFEPWTGEKSIADGGDILDYLKRTAAKYGIDEKIVYRTKLVSAEWSSGDAQWTLTLNTPEGERTVTAQYVYLCSGYYDYDQGYTPDFAGLEEFTGEVIHPQFWPQDFDPSGKEIVVIGSGATAVTLAPALADRGAQVTMLQRTPSYVLSLPNFDPLAGLLRRVASPERAYSAIRMKNAVQALALYQASRKAPKAVGTLLRKGVMTQVRGTDVTDRDFTPPYNPWDQRLCLVPDGDLFTAIREKGVNVVTDTIDSFVPEGIRTGSGRVLDADVIVTATGLKMLAAGGASLEVDGEKVDLGDRYIYRGMMVSGVPNAAMCVGYTNASWTLRADLSSQYLCTFINYQDAHGYAYGYPHVESQMPSQPALDLNSGYVLRAMAEFPKQGDRAPWFLHQNYLRDRRDTRKANVAQDMVFVRAGEPHTIEEPAAPAIA
ncbi:NAD(P)/FAD-dependent oxidoreductase [Yimella sp. cx-51]|nr:NAD(P)/FAD-dependent oxidoreductase [Yimella sp. cx-51]QTH39694.1 NAD(P)/FAD-dependent oxidoreductase [Yimella sp. cx-51]